EVRLAPLAVAHRLRADVRNEVAGAAAIDGVSIVQGSRLRGDGPRVDSLLSPAGGRVVPFRLRRQPAAVPYPGRECLCPRNTVHRLALARSGRVGPGGEFVALEFGEQEELRRFHVLVPTWVPARVRRVRRVSPIGGLWQVARVSLDELAEPADGDLIGIQS